MSPYVYIFVMAAVTYLIRMVPLTLMRRKIENRFLKSFLYYVPYACLMAMTFPAVFYEGENPWCIVAGVLVASLFALRGKGLMLVAVAGSVTVYLSSLVMAWL